MSARPKRETIEQFKTRGGIRDAIVHDFERHRWIGIKRARGGETSTEFEPIEFYHPFDVAFYCEICGYRKSSCRCAP